MFTHLCLWDVDPYVFDQGFMQRLGAGPSVKSMANLETMACPSKYHFFLVYLPHQYISIVNIMLTYVEYRSRNPHLTKPYKTYMVICSPVTRPYLFSIPESPHIDKVVVDG